MKKSFILISLATAIVTNTNAQSTGDTQEMKDPKAKAILDKLSEQNKNYNTISANFDYNLKNSGEGIDETQSGKLITKGNKYKLEIAGQQIISDGTTAWTFLKDDCEVQIQEAEGDDEEGIFDPVSIFTIYENGFKYKFDSDNGTTQIINLYPEDANEKSYHTIKLLVDKAKTQITSIVIKAKDGNTYTYNLKSFDTNKNFSDDFFKFKVENSGCDEVEEIDLR